jgi:hypothetical protein
VRSFTYGTLNRQTRESRIDGSNEVGFIASSYYSDGTLMGD